MNEIRYRPSPTLWKLHQSSKFVRGIMGPVGSGKSVGCCWEIFKRASEQAPSEDGVARTRWAVVRNTYRELEDTTLKTWLDWFPENVFGRVHYRTMTHTLRQYDDEGNLTHEIEVLFRALDKPKDIQKLLSMELTGAWLNEAREIPQAIKDALETRLGRYPAKRDGGPTWWGLIMDTNPPDDDHWWYKLAEEDTPANHEFFRQPGGMTDNAENVDNLPAGYYDNLATKGSDFVRVYVDGEYGYVQEGKPVFPEYKDSLHCLEHEPRRDIRYELFVGADFGLTPAGVFVQRRPDGGYIVVDEYVNSDLATASFAKAMAAKLQSEMGGENWQGYGDPSGDSRQSGDENADTTFSICSSNGLNLIPARTNVVLERLEAVKYGLSTLINGVPLLQISPKCRVLRKGLNGKYCYRRINVGGGERFHDKPDKNDFSHVNDALQYALLGAGLSGVAQPKNQKPTRVINSVRPPGMGQLRRRA